MILHAAIERGKRFFTFFRSARVTVAVIAVLSLLFFTGLIVPQKAFFQSGAAYDRWKEQYPLFSALAEFLGLNEIYTAPITVFFLVLFFANLFVVLASRVPVVLRRAYLLDADRANVDRVALKRDPGTRTIEIAKAGAGDIAARAAQALKRRFWFPVGPADGRSFTAVKNRYSPLGFLFFHMSFVLCLVGGLLVMYTRFSGNLVLTEGQEFHSDLKQFRTITRDPKVLKELPPISLSLKRVVPRYDRGVPTDLDVNLSIIYRGESDDRTMKINQPVKKGAVSLLAGNIGVSPLFVLKTQSGRYIDGGFVSLKVLQGEEDSFAFQGVPYTFYVKFYPDYAAEEGKEFSRSKELKNPVTRLRVQKGARIVAEGRLGLGRSVAFDSLALSFEDIRYWADFLIVREYGTVPLFLGFALGAAGLVMRLIFYQKTVKVLVEDGGQHCLLLILGHSEYYQYSFAEEMDRLAGALAGILARPERTAQPAMKEA